jgi:arginine/lysine/ornithine decarboxylase
MGVRDMGPTPLYDALKAFAGEHPLRLHMPGHKGRILPLPELSPAAVLDFTELAPTGDLFSGEGPIRAAETLWAEAFGMEECLFLTGGSTQGMLTALTLAAGTKASVLLDRGSHRSAYNALALLDLSPTYLDRPWLEGAGVYGPVDPQVVDQHLENRPDIKTVCITSPTYYGILSDIPALANLVHAHGGKLVVDAAHGAHLPFLGNAGYGAADLVVASAHKTLPALGQGALLFAGAGFSHASLRRAGSLYGSSSPSYLLMASLDGARAWMEDEGHSAYRTVCLRVARLRGTFPSLSDGDAPLDGARFVLKTGDGFALQEELEARGVYPEMADRNHVVFIFTCADGARDFARLEQALREIDVESPPYEGIGSCPPPPEIVLSPREARFAAVETVALRDAEGRLAACQVAPYPPGVPVVAPGELLSKKHLAYLTGIGYNMEQEVQVVAL